MLLGKCKYCGLSMYWNEEEERLEVSGWTSEHGCLCCLEEEEQQHE